MVHTTWRVAVDLWSTCRAYRWKAFPQRSAAKHGLEGELARSNTATAIGRELLSAESRGTHCWITQTTDIEPLYNGNLAPVRRITAAASFSAAAQLWNLVNIMLMTAHGAGSTVQVWSLCHVRQVLRRRGSNASRVQR